MAGRVGGFSQSRANKLMRIFTEYGAGQFFSSNSDSNPNLNYSQAVLLLGIPKEERAQFILDMDIEGMTKQEDHRKTVAEQSSIITGLTEELADLKVQLERVRASQIAFLCENPDKTLKQVKHELLQIAPNDKETYIIYKNKVYDLLNVWLKDETWSR